MENSYIKGCLKDLVQAINSDMKRIELGAKPLHDREFLKTRIIEIMEMLK